MSCSLLYHAGLTLLFLLVLFTSARARECKKKEDFFTRLCSSKNYGNTNADLPESLGNRSSCGLIGYPDGTFKPTPVKAESKPCEALQYTIAAGVFSMAYVEKCGHELYKVTASPNKVQKNSIVYWRTMSDENDPSYYVAVFCKRGRVVGKYAEVSESLSDEDIHDLKTVYGINVTHDEIDKCLEDADADTCS